MPAHLAKHLTMIATSALMHLSFNLPLLALSHDISISLLHLLALIHCVILYLPHKDMSLFICFLFLVELLQTVLTLTKLVFGRVSVYFCS